MGVEGWGDLDFGEGDGESSIAYGGFSRSDKGADFGACYLPCRVCRGLMCSALVSVRPGRVGSDRVILD